jgi:glycosyltransferase involved in cell wall biosynthesis
MRVAVAIPCYNGAVYLGQAIESLLVQSRPADEILIIDDGSTDESVQVAERYPVRLIRHSVNQGLASARNTAIAATTADILVFMDVDAYADRELLTTLMTGYDAADIGGVGGQGIEVNIQTIYDRWRRVHASQGYGPRPRERCPFLFGLCMSFRVEALRHVGGFNPVFHTNSEDVDIGYRLNDIGYRLRYLPQAKVYHQRTDDRASLLRTMTTWYTAAYYAKWINHRRPWTLFVGSLRRLITDPLFDLLIAHDPTLARISFTIGCVKLVALWNIAQKVRRKT